MTPIIIENIEGLIKSMKVVVNIETADTWLPIYTDKITATGTDDTKIPKNIPIEQEIDIAAKLTERESKVFCIIYSGKLPEVHVSMINPVISDIPVAIIKHKYTAKYFASRIEYLETGFTKNKS